MCTHVKHIPVKRCTDFVNQIAIVCIHMKPKRGYGDLIARARAAAPIEPKELARAIHKTVSTLKRLENEETLPTVDEVNDLVRVLPISADDLLMAMGVQLSGPRARLLPLPLVNELLDLALEDRPLILRSARALNALRRAESGQDPR